MPIETPSSTIRNERDFLNEKNASEKDTHKHIWMIVKLDLVLIWAQFVSFAISCGNCDWVLFMLVSVFISISVSLSLSLLPSQSSFDKQIREEYRKTCCAKTTQNPDGLWNECQNAECCCSPIISKNNNKLFSSHFDWIVPCSINGKLILFLRLSPKHRLLFFYFSLLLYVLTFSFWWWTIVSRGWWCRWCVSVSETCLITMAMILLLQSHNSDDYLLVHLWHEPHISVFASFRSCFFFLVVSQKLIRTKSFSPDDSFLEHFHYTTYSAVCVFVCLFESARPRACVLCVSAVCTLRVDFIWCPNMEIAIGWCESGGGSSGRRRKWTKEKPMRKIEMVFWKITCWILLWRVRNDVGFGVCWSCSCQQQHRHRHVHMNGQTDRPRCHCGMAAIPDRHICDAPGRMDPKPQYIWVWGVADCRSTDQMKRKRNHQKLQSLVRWVKVTGSSETRFAERHRLSECGLGRTRERFSK